MKYMTIHSHILNKTFYVEVIEDHPDNHDRSQWGDVDVVTKELRHQAYKPKDQDKVGVNMSDSIITKENGFGNINYLPPGTSPHGYIEMLEKEHFRKQLQIAIG